MRRTKIALSLFSLCLTFLLPAEAQKRKGNQPQQTEEGFAALRKWIDEDVAYVITDPEREVFKKLKTSEEREQFIEAFWLRRDPTPDTIENEYKDDHYSRIAVANDRFAAGLPGWKTDRGRIYILHGEPSEIESKPAGGTYSRPSDEGGGSTTVFPYEKWRYRYIEGIGTEAWFEFVDSSMSGQFRLTMDPGEKDALAHVPGVGLTEREIEYGIHKGDRWNAEGALLGSGTSAPSRIPQFDRLQNYVNAFKPPAVKFKDLESIVTTRLSFNLLPFEFRTDFIRVTEESVLTPITIQFAYKDLSFKEEQGVHRAVVHIYGKITAVNGRVAQVFEDSVAADIPENLFHGSLEKSAIHQAVIPLRPGLYKLNLALKDVQSGNVGNIERRLSVPRFDEEQLTISSLILADLMEDLPANRMTSGAFVLGPRKVRPNVKSEFLRGQNLSTWVQVYGLKVNRGTQKPSATIETLITRNGTEVRKIVEEAREFSSAAQQMTLTRTIPLSDLEAGQYSIYIKVTDNETGSLVLQEGRFAVR